MAPNTERPWASNISILTASPYFMKPVTGWPPSMISSMRFSAMQQ
jgi:hypothetical protein